MMIQSAKGPSGSASPDDIRRSATRVLTIEAEALAHMAAHLPADFAPAVECMMACTGRVIVAGIGKSGHIGRKIAATLASTGTPSHFVHVAEASHGDLGMLGSQDVCVLISNSGETAEMHDMIYHTQRFSIPLIGISSNASSTLMRAADYRLTLPNRPEACPIGMAPTTSTTLALALGDALAVALMERRGISAADFGVFHPGGKLGAQLRRVSDLMHGGDDMPTVDEDTPMSDVLLEMTSHNLGMAVVMGGGRITGVITDGDLRRNMVGLMERSAVDVANRDPLTVPPDCLASEALAILNARKVNVLLVADENRKPLGVLHIHDLLRAGVM